MFAAANRTDPSSVQTTRGRERCIVVVVDAQDKESVVGKPDI